MIDSAPTSTTTSQLPRPTRRIQDLPGPRNWPLVGHALQVEVPRIHQNIEDLARQYGPFAHVRLGPNTVLVLSDHELIGQILRDRPNGFRRPSKLAGAIREMGVRTGVFSAEGQSWQNQRRMVMSSFSPSHVRAYFPSLLKVTQRLQGRWRQAAGQGSTIELQADLMRFTVDAIAGLAFGADINTLESDEEVIQQHLDKIFPMLFKRINSLVPYWRIVKLPADRELDRSVAAVKVAIDDFIAQARQRLQADPARRSQPANLLEAMIVAADQPDSGVTDNDVAGNTFTMLLAGEDTTANTMAWLIHLLKRHPEILQRAQAEARAVAGDVSSFTPEKMAELHFLEACANETMRLKPVAPFQILEALHDTVVGDVEVPAGTLVWCVNRHDTLDERYFERPDEFMPQRWLHDEAGAAASVAKRVSTPFGAGPRVCPGRYMAMLEIKMGLAMLLNSFEIEEVSTPDGQEAQELMAFTMTPVGLGMRLRNRVEAAHDALA